MADSDSTVDGRDGRCPPDLNQDDICESESANVTPNPRKKKTTPIEFAAPPPRLATKPKMTTHRKQYPGGSVSPTSNKRK